MVVAERVSVAYGSKTALRNVDLIVENKEVMALIGPSGCGKSTFLRTLNRMHDETVGASVEGRIAIGGKNIYASNYPVVLLRNQVGMVFQRPNPFPANSIYDNVAIGVRFRWRPSKTQLNEIVEKSLRKAALWDEVKDKLKARGTSLSGGQQQRLCIARALAVEPKLLLMDEPTSALDPIATAKIEELIGEISQTTTIVIVTHNMQQAARISQRTAFFLMGEIIEVGKTRALFNTPKDPRTDRYISGQFG